MEERLFHVSSPTVVKSVDMYGFLPCLVIMIAPHNGHVTIITIPLLL